MIRTSSTSRGHKLPDGWRWAKLADLLVLLETGSRPKGGAAGIDEGIPSLSAEHMMRYGTFDFSTMRYVPHAFYGAMSRGHIQVGDVLIVKDGATTGKTCLVREDFPFHQAVINEHVFLCRPDRNVVDPEYLFWWVWGPVGQYAIWSLFQGAAIGGINQGFVQRLHLPLPPLPEQKRIVGVLREQMQAMVSARKAAEEQLAAAQALPAAYLREAFENKDAKGWPRRLLGEVVSFLTAKSLSTAGDTEVDAITTACLTEVGFSHSGIKKGKMRRGDVDPCTVSAGEVLIARSNTQELVGRVSVYQGEPANVVATDLTIRLWPMDGLTSDFLVTYLSYLYLTGYWREKAGGASGSMKKITRSHLKALKIPVPDARTQIRIMKSVAPKIVSARDVVSVAKEQIKALEAVPASLLRKAFAGEL